MLDKTWMMCTICSIRYWLERHDDRVEVEKGVSHSGGGDVGVPQSLISLMLRLLIRGTCDVEVGQDIFQKHKNTLDDWTNCSGR